MLLLTAASAGAQSYPGVIPLLRQVQEFLQLTDNQLQTILRNNAEYNQFSSTKQARTFQVQAEIATETTRDTVDPMALGLRYVEIESICREMKDQAVVYRQKNIAVLTDPQKAKLQVLQDAMKLAPAISDAQYGNLIGGVSYFPVFFAQSYDNGGLVQVVTGIILGGPINGCYTSTAFSSTSTRPGDVAPAPANGRALQTDPNMSHWFDTTKLVEPAGLRK